MCKSIRLSFLLPLALLAGCAKAPPPAAQPTAQSADAQIAGHRAAIDRIDAQVVDLLSQRAQHAQAIGRARAAAGIAPSSAKGRQQVVIDRAKQQARPPLPPEAAGRIFETIIAEMVAMQAKDTQSSPRQSPEPAAK